MFCLQRCKYIPTSSSVRNKSQKLVGRFLRQNILQVTDCCPIENVQEIWPPKIDFGQPNTEIGQKMANGRLISSSPSRHTDSHERSPHNIMYCIEDCNAFGSHFLNS